MTHLDKLRIWGKQIRVMASKHQAVQLPKEGQPDAGLTRDYAQNPLHRFKKPGSKNYQNIYPPSATLHLSNIPWVSVVFLVASWSTIHSRFGRQSILKSANVNNFPDYRKTRKTTFVYQHKSFFYNRICIRKPTNTPGERESKHKAEENYVVQNLNRKFFKDFIGRLAKIE